MNLQLSQDFIQSFSFDIRLAPYDIEGSIAHATMLGRRRIILLQHSRKIVRGLLSIRRDLQKGRPIPIEEDIHFAIERELIRRIGKTGQMLHTGRSRNDQVVTDLCLYLKDQIRFIRLEISRLQGAILAVAQKNDSVVMPGFTHLQHAQPILFAHHVLAYAWMFERDKARLEDVFKRVDVLPLGSAALGGTSFPIDRKLTARLLGFKKISENSMDATASRDTVVEFLAACAILMSNLSRLSEDLILWSTSEFGFVEMEEAFTSGSSIMPQKRNPDVAEIIRGETGRVYGSLMALLTLVKGLPLAYNRDLQEDKPPLFDAVDTVMGCLTIMSPMIEGMKVKKEEMQRWCDYGYLAATELADFLARRGVPFRQAHGVVRRLVQYCRRHGVRFEQMSLNDLRKYHPLFDKEALELLHPETVVRAKTSYGGTSPRSVARQMQKLRRVLQKP